MSDSRVYRNALALGTLLQEYKLEAVLGAGGFGMTYLGWDTHLEKHVAIKEYLPIELSVRALDGSVVPITSECEHDYKWGLDRFILEARTLARFSHPHIVRAMRFFEANATGYMVMEYEKGEPLNELLKREQPNEPRLREFLMPLLDGLQEVHSAGFLHRDIKPGNIFLRETGSPVLIDFGAARQAVGGATKSLTSVLTPGYAPLEQYSSDGHQGPWSDIYAMGGVLYRALTNENPPDAVSRMKNDVVPMKLAGAVGRASAPFLRSVEWALALDEKQRPQSIPEWRRALAGGPVPIAAARPAAPAAATVRSDAASAPTLLGQPAARLEPRRSLAKAPEEPEFFGPPWGWVLVALVVAVLGYGMWHKHRDSERVAAEQRVEEQRVAAERESERAAEERKSAEQARVELQEARAAEAEQRQRIAERDARFSEAEQLQKLSEREARVRELEQKAAERETAVKRGEEERARVAAQAAKSEMPRERPSREREERPGGPGDDLMRRSEQDFRSADANSDGYLDRREVERFPFMAKEFQRVDADGDGRVSQQEFLRAREEIARKFMKK